MCSHPLLCHSFSHSFFLINFGFKTYRCFHGSPVDALNPRYNSFFTSCFFGFHEYIALTLVVMFHADVGIRQAKAQLISEQLPIEEAPDMDLVVAARRRHCEKSRKQEVRYDVAADWLDFLREKVSSNQDRTQAEFRFFALKNQAAWLTPTSDEGPDVEEVVPGTCVMLSQNMQDLLRKILQSLDCT